MKIYDLSKELFSAAVYPGDPAPQKTPFFEISETCPCNVTVLSMGSHNGTHMDAPKHFVAGAKDVAEMDLEKCVGPCKVIQHHGLLTAEDAAAALADGTKRLLICGEIESEYIEPLGGGNNTVTIIVIVASALAVMAVLAFILISKFR